MITLTKYMSSKVSQSPLLPINKKRTTHTSKGASRKAVKRRPSPASASKSPKKSRQHKVHANHFLIAAAEYGYKSSTHYPSPNKPTAMNYILPSSAKNWYSKRGASREEATRINSSCLAVQSEKEMFREKRLTLNTQEENMIIKKKLEAYEALTKSRKEEKQNYGISHEDLKGKFNLMAARINILLAKEAPLEDIRVLEECKVMLNPGERKHYRLHSRMHPVPLRIRAELEKGFGAGRMLFSQGIIRPNVDNCDKMIPLAGRDVVGTYFSNRENEKFFIEENIYITIEADRELSLIFQCVYGKAGFKIRARTRNNDTGRQKEKFDTAEVNDSKDSIEDPRDGKYSQKLFRKSATRMGRIVITSTSPVKTYRKNRAWTDYEARKVRVNIMKEQSEQMELQRKFLLLHRRQINKQHEEIVNRKIKEFLQHKQRVKEWTAFIKLAKMSKLEKRKVYREMETRMFSALRIKVALGGKLRLYGTNIKDRMGMKALSGLVLSQQYTKHLAYDNSTNMLGEFLVAVHKTMEVRRSVLAFVKGIKQIQKRWKGMLRLNKTRKLVLRNLWDKMVEVLIKENQVKGKKQLPLIRKLRALSENACNKSLNNYYNSQKKKYYTLLAKWFDKKKAIVAKESKPQPAGVLVTIVDGPKEEKKRGDSSKDIKKTTMKPPEIEGKLPPYPSFKYIPPKATLRTMILQIANSS